MWPVKIGTNLTRPGILKLENAEFQFPKKECITSNRLFNISAPSFDPSGKDVLANPDFYPSSKQSKTTRWYATVAQAMHGTILKVTTIQRLGFDYVIMLQPNQHLHNSFTNS